MVWFDLQTLSYLIENKEGKTPKKLKIAISRLKIKISKNKKVPLVTGTKSFHHTKKQPPKSKTVAYKAYFAAKFEFSTKPEVVFKI